MFTWRVAGHGKVLGLGDLGFSDEGVSLGSSGSLSIKICANNHFGILLLEKRSGIGVAEDHRVWPELAVFISGDDGSGVQGSCDWLDIAQLPARLTSVEHLNLVTDVGSWSGQEGIVVSSALVIGGRNLVVLAMEGLFNMDGLSLIHI